MESFAAQLAAVPSLAGDGAALPLTVAGAVLLAAVTHAAWNAIAHGISDTLVAFTLHGVGAGLCAVPLVLLAGPPDPRSRPYLALSVSLHLVYNLLLMLSYRLGDFSQVYPLARGTSPLVVTVLAAVLVGEVPAPGQALGVLLISAGLGCLVLLGRRRRPANRTAVLAAVGTGLTIAAYSTVDGLGVRLAGGALGYIAWLMLLHSGLIPLLAVALRGRRLFAQCRPVWHVGMLGGLASILAYGLVLWAQTRGALGPIAALRETSVVFGAIIGALFFHERFGRARVAAAALVAAGAVTLNVT